MKYSIQKATLKHKDQIISFIKTDWSNDHIFVKDKSFFDYHYKYGENLKFFISLDNNNNVIGVLGYIEYKTKDHSNDVFLSLWKARDIKGDSTHGLKLLDYLRKTLQPKTLSCTGINKKTINIYKFLGYTTGRMNHFFILNPNILKFNIAKTDNSSPPRLSPGMYSVESVSFSDMLTIQNIDKLCASSIPSKSTQFIYHRYRNHPYFKYQFFSINNNTQVYGIFITREIKVKNHKCLRVVDFIGESKSIKDCLKSLSFKLLNEKKYEFIDLLLAGLSSDDISFKGLQEVPENTNHTIIPSYFEPFEQKNIDIFYFTSIKSNYRIMRGDGDQDRPNLLQENK